MHTLILIKQFLCCIRLPLNIQSISPILKLLDCVQTFCRRIRESLTVLLKKLKM